MTFSGNDPDLFTSDSLDDEKRGFVISFSNNSKIGRLEAKRHRFIASKSDKPSGAPSAQPCKVPLEVKFPCDSCGFNQMVLSASVKREMMNC
jgi:hypothetical protein